MLLRSKLIVSAAALALSFAMISCDEEPPPEEVVQPSTTDEPAPPPDSTVDSYTPSTVYFAFDDYSLNSTAQGVLSDLANHMKASSSVVLQIEGHCDERGSIEYNLALGERRASSVKDYLVNLGISADRLSTISYGEEKPASEGHDESSWTKNRRAEFILTGN